MRKTWLIFSQAVTVAVAVLFVVSTLKPQWLQRSPTGVVPSVSIIEAPAVAAAPAPSTYSAAAKRAAHG